MTIKVKVTGLTQIEAALKNLPKATAKNVVRRVLKTHAQPIAEAARRLAPINRGDLSKSITVGTKLSKAQRSKHKKRTPNTVEMFVGAGTNPQAVFQEFGTVDHPPQPFMRPAWDSGKEQLLEGIKDDLWAEIQKAVGRQARKAAKAAAAAGGE
jgi:HK97 gp10 family phage protein